MSAENMTVGPNSTDKFKVCCKAPEAKLMTWQNHLANFITDEVQILSANMGRPNSGVCL